MKIIEKILVVLIAFGLILKITMLPFSGPLLVISIGNLAMGYLFFSWLLFKPAEKEQNLIITLISGFILANGALGILFKLMFWPGYSPLLMLSLGGLAALIIVIFIIGKKDTTKLYYNNMLTRLSIFLVVVLFFTFLPSKSLYAVTHRNDLKAVELYSKMVDNPFNEQYTNEYHEYIKLPDSEKRIVNGK